jgi:hypothetical protein
MPSLVEFTVHQFYADECCERVLELVDRATAMAHATRLIGSVGALLGTTVRVVVTDSAEETVFDWKSSEGMICQPTEARPPAGDRPVGKRVNTDARQLKLVTDSQRDRRIDGSIDADHNVAKRAGPTLSLASSSGGSASEPTSKGRLQNFDHKSVRLRLRVVAGTES